MTDRERLIADFRSKYYEAIGDWEPEVYLSIDEARNILQALDTPTVGGWISVKDRLPDRVGEEYIVYITSNDGEKCVTCDHWVGSSRCRWFLFDDAEAVVTHWMPLPEPPEEDATDGNH